MKSNAMYKHEIYGKLSNFSNKDLNSIVDFVDFLRQKNKIEKKIIKLEGILEGQAIDFSVLKEVLNLSIIFKSS